MSDAPPPRYIAIEQLCVGLYIYLDISWLNHSFARNSFKIKSEEQIAAIKQLGLTKIRVNPGLCECRPLPMPPAGSPPAPAPAAAELSAEEIAAIDHKKSRVELLVKERAAIAQCEKQFVKAATTLKSIGQNIFSRPQQAFQDAEQLTQQMLDSLLTDKDIAVHLMNDKMGGEDMYFHSLNVSVLAMMLAKELGLAAADIKQIGIGCLFHDIGKVEIPDRVTLKSEPLNRAEQNLLQQHCHYGEIIARKIGLSQAAQDIVLQHHEYADGSGYPQQLDLAHTSPLAQIVAVVNTYDNFCNKTHAKDSLTPHEALSYMFAKQRTLFAPGPFNLFIRCLGIYPPGTLVRLSDATIGMVIGVNSSTPLRPRVLIYDQGVPKDEAIILDLLNEPELTISGSMHPKDLSAEMYEYLSPRKRMTYFFDTPQAKPASA